MFVIYNVACDNHFFIQLTVYTTVDKKKDEKKKIARKEKLVTTNC